MKLKDKKDLIHKSTEELQKLLVDAKKSLFNLRTDLTMGKLKNSRQVFWKRKEIAYLLTHLRRKELTNA